jgi:hypothetical protein
MAVVFLEGGLSPIPMRMASTKFHHGPRRRVCQFALSKAKGCKSQTQFVAKSLFFGLCDIARLKYHQKTTIKKITIATVKN